MRNNISLMNWPIKIISFIKKKQPRVSKRFNSQSTLSSKMLHVVFMWANVSPILFMQHYKNQKVLPRRQLERTKHPINKGWSALNTTGHDKNNKTAEMKRAKRKRKKNLNLKGRIYFRFDLKRPTSGGDIVTTVWELRQQRNGHSLHRDLGTSNRSWPEECRALPWSWIVKISHK